jgi:hypothetical protein
MRGTRANPVQLADVEMLAEQTSRRYGHAPLRVDPREPVAMAQGLRDRGMSIDDKQLTEGSVGKIGANLHLLLREHRMALPYHLDLIDELLNVRLKTTALGGMRLDHDAGNHDDQAMSLGLAALALVEHPISHLGGFSISHLLIAARNVSPREALVFPAARALSTRRIGIKPRVDSSQRSKRRSVTRPRRSDERASVSWCRGVPTIQLGSGGAISKWLRRPGEQDLSSEPRFP